MNTQSTTHSDSDYEMPSAEAMLAGTLALMTGYAQSACLRQRHLMSEKIVANLSQISQHPAFSANFQAVTDRMSPLWAVLAQAGGVFTSAQTPAQLEPKALWHTAVSQLQ